MWHILIIVGFAGLVLFAILLALGHVAPQIQLGLDSRLPSEKELAADHHIHEPQDSPESLTAKGR
ncbi:MAG: hypothetical protein HY649_00405 [Acidobacteria bacterium]|nr:hypothetical protein [Acidobacteriota bacterium]